MKLNILKLGLLTYKAALDLQEKMLLLRQQNEIPDTLILLEHPPVLTLGRRGEYENILFSKEILEAQGVKIYEVNRGGDVTYHGPGQIVGYPIMDLSQLGKDIKEFVYKIEEVFIRLLLNEFEIKATRDKNKYTGVWVGNKKITAIGIAVKRWITMHGFAFNVNTDLTHFDWINPCGITDKGVSSVKKLLGREMDFFKMNELVIKYFSEVFEADRMDVKCIRPSRNG
ncbi:lipoyl(octanoyl) transferase LipB [Desulfosporosinus sp. BICA1-9]|uniref:lipoyl(octanoyl) transferase LipB n=1 Tax=Desulfosporosinus sp. BICA1-9 TaxID=1531958 RepID=UPI00054B7950|nr:lipoyl(octanoyl) transferase LipB [Desulfosporosinus sp. BICA1-9]KJS50542.1 MAG: octanoyltransferase [Peptococcaceae bacterium BRH_c23]KJS82809.1 MAG: octanoyltransferase [Desulfosporosinus sp. BICA1-9]